MYMSPCGACCWRRAEIEAQEGVIEQLEGKLAGAERRLKEAERRAAAAEAAVAEKEGMLGYVGEEVERVKALFEQKARVLLGLGVVGRAILGAAAQVTAGVLGCTTGQWQLLQLRITAAQATHAMALAPLCCPQEARLAQERDAARREAAQAGGERKTLAAMVQQLEGSVRELEAALRTEKATAAGATEAAARHQARSFLHVLHALNCPSVILRQSGRATAGAAMDLLCMSCNGSVCPALACRAQAEAARAAVRVGEVEEELREVLGALEAHKAASATKFHQLQTVLADLQAPFLQLPL